MVYDELAEVDKEYALMTGKFGAVNAGSANLKEKFTKAHLA